jgi:hypothetical protein
VADVITDTRDEWLAVTPVSGSVDYGQTDTLDATLDAGTLVDGVYYSTIMVTSNDPDQDAIEIPVTLTVNSGYTCEYMPGDVNSDGLVIGSDVTFMVNFFRGIGAPPPDSCFNESTQSWLYVAADANGDCRVIGSDVTFLVTYFRGIVAQPNYCDDLPPSNQQVTVSPQIDMPANKE